jgi:uncharacterized protein (DUF302 family)
MKWKGDDEHRPDRFTEITEQLQFGFHPTKGSCSNVLVPGMGPGAAEQQSALFSPDSRSAGSESFVKSPHHTRRRTREISMKYGFSKTVKLSYEQAIEKVTEELKKEGFGVLTTIDVKDTLKKKLNVDFSKYIILGACNPPFAHQALTAEEEIGLLLPCNVIVYEKQGTTRVSIFDPMVMEGLVDNTKVGPIAKEVKERLQRVLAAV